MLRKNSRNRPTTNRQLKNHRHLTLVIVNEEPRKCAQSTSERNSSQVTRRADSRSISIARDSPQGLKPYATLRRWPLVVPQRDANCSRSSGVMDFQKTLSCMDDYHHMVISNATPLGEFTKWCNTRDNQGMANPTAPIRRANLRRLIERDFGNNQSAFSQAVYPDRTPSYVNDLLRESSDKPKSFGEIAARKIEDSLGLARGQMDIENSPLAYVPGHRHRLKDELLEAINSLDGDEQLEALTRIRRILARRPPRKKVG